MPSTFFHCRHKWLLCHNNPVIKKFVHYPLWVRPFVMIAIFSRAHWPLLIKPLSPGTRARYCTRDLMVTTSLSYDWSAEVTWPEHWALIGQRSLEPQQWQTQQCRDDKRLIWSLALAPMSWPLLSPDTPPIIPYVQCLRGDQGIVITILSVTHLHRSLLTWLGLCKLYCLWGKVCNSVINAMCGVMKLPSTLLQNFAPFE